jgi:hypothetical protein
MGLIKNPALVVQREAEVTFAQFDARFGLTPSGPVAVEGNRVVCPGQSPPGTGRMEQVRARFVALDRPEDRR